MKKVFLTIRQSKWLGLLTQISPTIKLFVVLLLLACGPSPADYGEFFSLFYPESATFPTDTKPYFYSPLLLNSDSDYLQNGEPSQEESQEVKENIDAWHSFLRGSIEKPVIKEGIYGKHRSNAFAKTIGHSFPEAARYLALSLEIESKTPFYQYSWEKPDAIDTIRLAALQQEAKALMLQSQEPFLKERYLFQYTKLCAVNGNNDQILKEYTTLEKTIKEKTFITDWSRSRLAGAKIAMGDTAEAIFDFAQIFNNCPSRRTQADLSVRRLPAHYFEEAQKYCKTKDQKANLYALTAIQPFRDGLELAENIYEINPSHPMLELVIAREINKNERLFFAEKNSQMYASMDAYLDENYQPSSKKINQAKAEGQNYLQQLLSFTKKTTKAEKLKNNPFWALSTAYLLYLNNENTQASSYLSALEKTENPYVKKMSHFLKYEFADHTYNSANEAALINELSLFTDVKSFRDNNLLVKMSETLYDFYTNSEPEKKNTGWLASCSKTKTSPSAHFVKAFLALQIGASSSESYGYQLNKSQDFYTDTCSVAFLKQIMAFANQPSLTGSEKALLKYANLSPHYLALALARRQVAEHQYAAAAETFKRIPAAYLSSQGFDEYLLPGAKDFWDNEIQNGETAADLLLELSVLKQKTQTKNASANTWYAYGKQLYNLSYFGQGWILSKRKRSEYDLMQGNTLSDDFYTTKNARKCFDQALRLQPSAELAAKICYAGALCERNQYLTHYYSSQPKDFEKLEQHSAQMTQTQLPKYRTYFNLLWQKYRNTQYHKEIMNECETYAAFVP